MGHTVTKQWIHDGLTVEGGNIKRARHRIISKAQKIFHGKKLMSFYSICGMMGFYFLVKSDCNKFMHVPYEQKVFEFTYRFEFLDEFPFHLFSNTS